MSTEAAKPEFPVPSEWSGARMVLCDDGWLYSVLIRSAAQNSAFSLCSGVVEGWKGPSDSSIEFMSNRVKSRGPKNSYRK